MGSVTTGLRQYFLKTVFTNCALRRVAIIPIQSNSSLVKLAVNVFAACW